MPFHRLQDFVAHVEAQGDLHRIKTEVDPVLEITEITTRVHLSKGKALLFERVKGSPFPLLINALGTERRLEWALGRSPVAIAKDIHRMAEGFLPPEPKKLWALRGDLGKVLAMHPKKVRRAAVFSNKIEPANLDQLPIAQSWPLDGGRFITFPLVVTKSPNDGKQNMGIYRMQKFDDKTTGMHWQIGKGGGYHYQEAEAMNQPLKVAVVLGADPVMLLSGVLPLPEGLDEMRFAGFLRGQSTRVTSLGKESIMVPAEAEFILEGFVPPHERRLEGPYGDHFGHYSLAAQFPFYQVERIWHRPNPIFPIAVVGKPPQEDQVLGDAVQEILLPILKIMRPEIIDLWAYFEAGFHNLLVISVRQRFDKEAVKSALWALGEGQLALTKFVILVDQSVNPRKFPDVLNAIRQNFDSREDFYLLPNTSQDTLDFSGPKMNHGSKMILDATGTAKSALPKDLPTKVEIAELDSSIEDSVILEGTMLIMKGKKLNRDILKKISSYPKFQALKLVVAVSPDVPLTDPVLLLWGIFTRFDCYRDTFFTKYDTMHGHPLPAGPLFIDATWKSGYPEPLEMSEDITKLVDRRWKEYGF